MRRPYVFVSIPDTPYFRVLFEEAIRPLERQRLYIECWLVHPQARLIPQEINRRIGFSNAVIAVATGLKPNIVTEIGIALGYGKPLVPVIDDVDELPVFIRDRAAVSHGGMSLDELQGAKGQQLYQHLHARLHVELEGAYAPQRTRTHTELLLAHTPSAESQRGRSSVQEPLQAAIYAYDQRNFVLAISLLEDALVDGLSGSETAHFYAADAHFLEAESLPNGAKKEQHYAKMLEIAQAGHAKFPSHLDLHKTLGLAYLKCGDLDEASKHFATLIAANQTYTVARYNLACVHAQRRDLMACLRELRAAIAEDPNWRVIARLDPDFDRVWFDELFQRLIYPMPTA